MMQMLDNHVVVILGGGSGLGLGLARYCRAEGASVAIVEVAEHKVGKLRAEFGDDVLVLQGDVRSVGDLVACRDAVLTRFGRVDALIGAQGIYDNNVPLVDVPLDRIDALFDEIFHVNVKGYILAARVFHEALEASAGAIVLTSSNAAFAADGGGVFYTASKGAVVSVVNQLAFEFAPHIRVNGVAPSGIANSELRGPGALGMDGFTQDQIPKDLFLQKFHAISLLPNLPQPEHYGAVYAFLASRNNTIMTGQTVVADQGLLNRAILTER
jgi:NAD(P)-dependent dehydrogenase (short-subunit alcohol dehydrogenase family)